MNKVVLMGRLVRDPEVRYNVGANNSAVARYTLAVDRRFKKDGEAAADFISCVVFGKSAEFAEKFFHKGIRICISGHLRTGSYTNREGQKVYTTDVVIEEQEFAESKNAERNTGNPITDHVGHDRPSVGSSGGFMDIPQGMEDELPFA